jgi:hypothetical protein
MRAPSTSYAELGLSPDADRGAVERADSARMKVHHPDRGGDLARAAAINRAYDEITRPTAAAPVLAPPDLANAIYERRIAGRRAAATGRGGRRRWPWLLLLASLLGGLAWLEWDPFEQAILEFRWRYFPSLMIDPTTEADSIRGTEPSDSVEAPISAATIDRSVARARLVLAKGGLDLAGDTSERCYHGLANAPSFAALDACLALDDAVMLLAGSAAADKRGFGAVALTARQLAAGRAMGGDFGAIEERLDRVRLMTLKVVEPGTQLSPQSRQRASEEPSRP